MSDRNSLGIAKPPAQTRVVVAMSGGVDSSVVAGLLAREGYIVVGVTLQLYDHGKAARKKGACCAGRDIRDATRVAERLGIAHYVLDYEERFRSRVVAEFVSSYARGLTPIPCVRCNERVKFADLLELARDLGADALATGHYVRRLEGACGAELHMAADRTRDQSYFLFRTTRAQLDLLRFPLGDTDKMSVREMAVDLGLPVADKPDSQDICFVPDGDYARLVEAALPGSVRAGDIVDERGRVIGRHPGISHFTVGQRKGLGLSGTPGPLYVLALDAPRARVVVGPRAALQVRRIELAEVNWLADMRDTVECRVKVRSTRAPIAARITAKEDGRATVELPAGESAVAPGQGCVFYHRTRVLGGGWITKTGMLSAAA
ncbi:MAG: tRNA 2-thiouridine(34) synthase MnmA [Rhizomicrobium sp.]